MPGRTWKVSEEQFIAKNINKMSLSEIARTLDRTEQAIIARIYQKRMKELERRPWTSRENHYLRDHAREHSAEELAVLLNRSPLAIIKQCEKLHTGPKFKKRSYTDEELKFIRENAKDMTADEMGKALKRDVKYIRSLCHRMGIKLKTNRVAVYKLDLKTNAIIDRYESISSAAKMNNIPLNSVSRCVHGLASKTGGYKWMTCEEYGWLNERV